MKKKISLMLAVIMLLQIVLPMVSVIWESGFTIKSIAAETLEATDSNGITWTYELQDGKAINVKPKDRSTLPTEVIIPNALDGHQIKSIRTRAFYECSSLTSIEIPSSVTSIGDSAFYECSSLTSIELPNSVTSIGAYVFQMCTNLKSITIPSSVTKISHGAFSMCISLTNIEILEGATSIEDRAFENCRSLTGIEIPSSVTSIGEGAFSSCDSLTSIEIPEGVTSIGSYTFYYCDSLTSIEIPDSVTSIAYGAFFSCASLTNIEIPASVTSIDEYAFEGCSSLTIYCKSNSVAETYAKDNSLNYVIDDEAPTITSVEGNPQNWTKEKVVLKVNASDSLSGLAEKAYSFDGGKTWQAENTKEYTENTSGIVIKVKDSVGNVKTYEEEINITKIARLTGIEITQVPSKTEYVEGQTFNPEGMEVKATYDNGTTEIVEGYTINPDRELTTEDTKVTISYTENGVTKTAEIEVTVIKKGDVNVDSFVDFMDILQINKHRLGKIQLTGIYLEVADVTGDGIANFDDIMQINKYRLGKITSL